MNVAPPLTRWHFASLVLVAMSVLGCQTGGGGSSSSSSVADPEAQRNQLEIELRALVESDISAAIAKSDSGRSRLISRKPYYLQEYSVYPDGATGFTLTVTESESRTVPLSGSVTLEKVRFSTPLRKKKEVARADTDFQRDTGTETTTYQYRNSRWYRVASIFLADSSEVMVNGEWRPLEQASASSIDARPEQNNGFFRRTMRRLRLSD